MTKVITLLDAAENAENLVSELTVRSMKYNYPDFVKEYGHSRADQAMERVYGDQWNMSKEEVLFWFENDFHRDEEGNIYV